MDSRSALMLTSQDVLALKRGWKIGFGDDDEFIDYFFAHYDSDTTRAVVRNERGKIVAQMHYFIFNDEVCGARGCYIYGVTTLPQYQGKGLARKMINGVLEDLREQGIAYAVLIAQEEGLRKWYAQMGFELRPRTIEVRGAEDDMNFAMDTPSLNQGMYHLLTPPITTFTPKILISHKA